MTTRQAMQVAFFLKSIACTFPPSATRRRRLASVLDLEQYHLFRIEAVILPYSGRSDDTDVNLSIRCQFDAVRRPHRHPLQDDQTHGVCLMIMQVLSFTR